MFSEQKCLRNAALKGLYGYLVIQLAVQYVHTFLRPFINPLTPELNPSAQRCLTRFFLLGIMLFEPCI
jgi:hypothetical protein